MLGFEDCSARVEDIGSAALTLSQPYVKQHEQLSPKSWAFYGFDVTPEDYQVVVNVATEKDTTCERRLGPSSMHACTACPSCLTKAKPSCMKRGE